ncbi:uncharacterized protein LOC132563006 [Ylistrum balloti]|uniref:uncharacterized protein LOC132563006 n=1 Tax=Ylistrum balloti TaxID=509963 RepID=UPI002905D095|nr:uncharacterized protein LOC132563006 [Ylistrum balloti]
MYMSLVILVVTVFTVSGQSITLTGTSTLQTPASELKITCQPSPVGINDVNSIRIRKNTSTTDYTTIVSVTYDKPSALSLLSWGTTGHQNRQGVTVTGNVDSVSGAQLVLTIAANWTTCNDGGAYQCIMGVTLTGGSGGVTTDDKYVTAKESPTYTNSLSVTPLPNVNSNYYSVGTMMTFSCTGTVGTDKQRHTWCYKRASDSSYTGYPTASHINQNDDGLIKENCNYKRTSTLTYNVTSADSNTTFMCEPYTGTVCGSNPAQLKSYYSIRNYISSSTTTVYFQNTDNVGSWIVAGISIAVNASLVVCVVCLWLKVRKYKELLHQQVDYEVVNKGSQNGNEHVYNIPEHYEIPSI